MRWFTGEANEDDEDEEDEDYEEDEDDKDDDEDDDDDEVSDTGTKSLPPQTLPAQIPLSPHSTYDQPAGQSCVFGTHWDMGSSGVAVPWAHCLQLATRYLVICAQGG